jgi:hypothetical protein
MSLRWTLTVVLTFVFLEYVRDDGCLRREPLAECVAGRFETPARPRPDTNLMYREGGPPALMSPARQLARGHLHRDWAPAGGTPSGVK